MKKSLPVHHEVVGMYERRKLEDVLRRFRKVVEAGKRLKRE